MLLTLSYEDMPCQRYTIIENITVSRLETDNQS